MYEGTAHHGVGRIANSMRGVHAVFHAPQGDDYVNPIFTMLERTPAFPQMTTSVVSGRDLATGSIRLPETLQQVEAKLHPKLIIICASCSTILLQEDLQVVANSAHTEAEVLVYDANPYRMQETTSADGLFSLLVKKYAKAQPRTAKPSINIIGPASLGFHVRSDLICLRRIFKTLGVEINVVAPLGAGLDDLEKLPAAWATIAPYRELGQEAARYLEAQFGVPALTEAPIGVQPTLRWLKQLAEQLGVTLPPLTAFSLDGMSAPSGVPWFARTADMESFSSKRAFVFGDATHTVGMVKFLHDELGMEIAGAGTYLAKEAAWVRDELRDYLPAGSELLVTEQFQHVSARIEELQPDLVCGTQMERHACRKFDIPVMVIAPPTHIEDHLLSYRPLLGFDGADVLADTVYTTATLGMEKHLIDMFGDAGLDYAAEGSAVGVQGSEPEAVAVGLELRDTSSYADAAARPLTPDPRSLVWSDDATGMLKKIPFFVRGRVQKKVEQYAIDNSHVDITTDVLLAAKESFGG